MFFRIVEVAGAGGGLLGATTGIARTAAVVAAAGLVILAAFQVSLALGAPLGRAAWGGTRTHLPTGLRVASAVAVVVWLLAAAIVLGRAGSDLVPLPAGALRWGTWILFGLLLVGALMNVASKSPWERYLWGPFAFVLAILCFVVARSPLDPAA
jgi:hypothetical protein